MGGAINILCVEDDDIDQRFLERALKKLDINLEVTFVSSLGAARSSISSQKYDLVIADQNLPDGQGSEIVFSLRKWGEYVSPILIYTGVEDSELRASLEENENVTYRNKATSTREIQDTVMELLKLPQET